MTGRRVTFDDSTVCSIERALVHMSFYYLFLIEGNAVSVINLTITLVVEILLEKLSKMVVKAAATSNSTHTTKIIQKEKNDLKQHTILFNFKSS